MLCCRVGIIRTVIIYVIINTSFYDVHPTCGCCCDASTPPSRKKERNDHDDDVRHARQMPDIDRIRPAGLLTLSPTRGKFVVCRETKTHRYRCIQPYRERIGAVFLFSARQSLWSPGVCLSRRKKQSSHMVSTICHNRSSSLSFCRRREAVSFMW
jgi:hypothetical protein